MIAMRGSRGLPGGGSYSCGRSVEYPTPPRGGVWRRGEGTDRMRAVGYQVAGTTPRVPDSRRRSSAAGAVLGRGDPPSRDPSDAPFGSPPCGRGVGFAPGPLVDICSRPFGYYLAGISRPSTHPPRGRGQRWLEGGGIPGRRRRGPRLPYPLQPTPPPPLSLYGAERRRSVGQQ